MIAEYGRTIMIHDYRVSFVTPAFLGDAEQKGRWRTPPFKALLRQWWRIAAAREFGHDHEKLREAEGRLFGHAWLKNSNNGGKTWAMQSRIRLRLDKWSAGGMAEWPKDPQVRHPEVKRPTIGAHLYLGYGPLTNEKGGTVLDCVEKGGDVRPAIEAGDSARLRLIGDDPHRATVMQLIHWFGTIGGRAANGWGSIALEGDALAPIDDLLAGRLAPLSGLSRPWTDCLDRDWPHAFGSDEKGLLVWKTEPHGDWSSVMKALAEVKIAFRTEFPFGHDREGISDRHVLAYPVTNHSVPAWGRDSRLANQIRFKVARTRGGVVGLIYHLPSRIPERLRKELGSIGDLSDRERRVWRSVHGVLDHNLTRIGGVGS